MIQQFLSSHPGTKHGMNVNALHVFTTISSKTSWSDLDRCAGQSPGQEFNWADRLTGLDQIRRGHVWFLKDAEKTRSKTQSESEIIKAIMSERFSKTDAYYSCGAGTCRFPPAAYEPSSRLKAV